MSTANDNNMIISRDALVKVGRRWKWPKMSHRFNYIDVPAGCINLQTGQFEPCVNNRGFGYAFRNRIGLKGNRKRVERRS